MIRIRNWIKAIIKEALEEWESEVSYLGRPGYEWNGENWVPKEQVNYRGNSYGENKHPTWTLDEFQE